MTVPKHFICFIVILSLFASCSGAKRDWETIQKLQDSKSEAMRKSMDFGSKVEACQVVIDSLNAFLHRHRESEYVGGAQDAMQIWQNRKRDVERQEDYEGVKATEGASGRVLETTYDYDVRGQACDNIIKACELFLSKYADADEALLVRTTLEAWSSRRETLEGELSELFDRFGVLSKKKATNVALGQHSLSHVESIELENREKNKDGAKYVIRDVYSVRMKGNIIGRSIFKLRVTVDGTISPESKQVSVSDKAVVEE